jgi:hypothetical protein
MAPLRLCAAVVSGPSSRGSRCERNGARAAQLAFPAPQPERLPCPARANVHQSKPYEKWKHVDPHQTRPDALRRPFQAAVAHAAAFF